jgi:hypothetical protein
MIKKEKEKGVVHAKIAIHPSTTAPLQQELSREWQECFEKQECITTDMSAAPQSLLSSLEGEV